MKRIIAGKALPDGVVLLPRAGVLRPHAKADVTFARAQHAVGVPVGVSARIIASPFLAALELGKSAVEAVGDTQMGQSTKYGWHRQAHLEDVIGARVRNRGADVEVMKAALDAAGFDVSNMSDGKIRAEFAGHTTRFSYEQPGVTDAWDDIPISQGKTVKVQVVEASYGPSEHDYEYQTA